MSRGFRRGPWGGLGGIEISLLCVREVLNNLRVLRASVRGFLWWSCQVQGAFARGDLFRLELLDLFFAQAGGLDDDVKGDSGGF